MGTCEPARHSGGMGGQHRHLRLSGEAQGGASQRPVSSPTATPDGDEEIVRCELLAAALRRLTVRQRLVVVWRFLFDFSVRDTATALGLTESKVRDASHNGVERLRKLLGEEWSELT